MSVSNASGAKGARAGEKAALSVIGMVLDGGAFFNIALADVLQGGGFSDADRGAASAVARSVIENIRAVDYALGRVTNLKRCKKTVRNILRIGAARIMYTDMPGAKAVSSAVDICRAVGKGAQAGYVNATLRALSQKEIPWPEDKIENIALRYSWPEWFCSDMADAFGWEFAEAFLSYRQQGPVSLRANPRINTRDELIAQLPGAQPSPMDDDGILVRMANAAGTELYKQGCYSLQGGGSMMAARQALADGLVIDLCAAPGGKSTYIAERMDGQVVACDLHEHRVELIARQAGRLGLDNIIAMQHDATQPMDEYIGRADCVLVDAPCTGLGTALHRPDVKLNKHREDAIRLSEIQADILGSAAAMVRPGGRLVYCTCTPTPMENEKVISAFLEEHSEFRSEEESRLWPHIHGTDAFYICRMVKK